MGVQEQTGLFRGIYEFEDPAGTLLAAKSPVVGTADLFDGTAVVVKPNQTALLVYKGQIGDVLVPGTHIIKTENLPIISRLANWKFGFQNPLRCEIWFFARNVFPARRWGTPQPVVHDFEGTGPLSIRAYGNYSILIEDTKKLYLNLIGSRVSYDITDIEEMIQGQILETLPQAMPASTRLAELNSRQPEIALNLQKMLKDRFSEFGITIEKLQVLSLVPPREALQAMDAKTAINMIGDQKTYLLYKAANSLEAAGGEGGNHSMQMMMGLMLGKGLLGNDYHDKEASSQPSQIQARTANLYCQDCGKVHQEDAHFCPSCGRKI